MLRKCTASKIRSMIVTLTLEKLIFNITEYQKYFPDISNIDVQNIFPIPSM